ncbi:hypothetical protein [Burkholderia sp. LMG 21824]|uniref:hypothetical protein n=1 Tax=Burkholderia sp. LMG 21824 TaxID=3158172 RepID=UPI003C2D5985
MRVLRRLISILTVVTSSTATAATVQHFDAVGMSVLVPDDWAIRADNPKHLVDGRTVVQFHALHLQSQSQSVTCEVNRIPLPPNFARYPQRQLDDAYLQHPMTRDDWQRRIQQTVGVSALDLEFGQGKLGGDASYWSVTTTRTMVGNVALNVKIKTFLSQTPHYAWNVQCATGSLTMDEAQLLYRTYTPTFERIFQSFQHD